MEACVFICFAYLHTRKHDLKGKMRRSRHFPPAKMCERMFAGSVYVSDLGGVYDTYPQKRPTNEQKRPINAAAVSARRVAGRDCTNARVCRLIDLVYGKRGLPIRKCVSVQTAGIDTHA